MSVNQNVRPTGGQIQKPIHLGKYGRWKVVVEGKVVGYGEKDPNKTTAAW